jgi:hypothetical protein
MCELDLNASHKFCNFFLGPRKALLSNPQPEFFLDFAPPLLEGFINILED